MKYRIQDHAFLIRDPESKVKFEEQVERGFTNRIARPSSHAQDYDVGFEYQITDDKTNPDARGNPKHAAGALYDMVAPSTAAARPVGEFNLSRIVRRGNHVEHC